ncbi:MAG: sedoheptulokinase [Faecousia sp.]
MNIIGLDIGTTSISAARLDPLTGEVQQTYTVANRSFLQTGNPWERIQNPDLIITTVRQLLDEILDSCPEVAVIGLTGQMHGIVYVDAAGKSISPLYTWQDGRGNQPEADGKSLCQRLTETYGSSFYSGYGLVTHLYNLRHHLVPAGAAGLCTIMDYLGMVLTGRKTPLVHASNAASFGFYDIASGTFRRELLEAEGADSTILPEVTASIAVLGTYRNIPVTIAIGDNQASFLGSVRHAKEEILINMGTGGQVSLLSDKILAGEDIETRPFIENSYLAVGASLCGGRAYASLASFFTQCANAFGVTDPDPYAMMDGLLRTYDNPEKLLVDTAFDGTRDHPERRGSIRNLTTHNFDPASLTYGVLDGIAGELYQRYQTMLAGAEPTHCRMIGSGNGIRRNPHLQKIAAQKFSMGLELSRCTEEAACGAAIAGFTTTGQITWQQAVGV